MTDDLQVVAQAYTYEAFGKLRSATGTGLLFANRYTYTARESIGDSLGFYYYRARVMDPDTGRFTNEDPLGFLDGVNRYLYVVNRPVDGVDPSGQSPFWAGAIFVGGGIAAIFVIANKILKRYEKAGGSKSELEDCLPAIAVIPRELPRGVVSVAPLPATLAPVTVGEAVAGVGAAIVIGDVVELPTQEPP